MGVVRILLAVWVLVVHSGPLFGVVGPGRPVNLGLNGDMSVTCFFVISGFLIAMIRNRRPTAVRAFYVSRAMRIYALYLLALALTVTVGWLTGLDRGRFEAIGAVIASVIGRPRASNPYRGAASARRARRRVRRRASRRGS